MFTFLYRRRWSLTRTTDWNSPYRYNIQLLYVIVKLIEIKNIFLINNINSLVLEEVVPAPEELVPAPEEIVPAPEEAVAAPEEVVLAPDEVVPAPEEVVPVSEEVVLPQEEQPKETDVSATVPDAIKGINNTKYFISLINNYSDPEEAGDVAEPKE